MKKWYEDVIGHKGANGEVRSSLWGRLEVKTASKNLNLSEKMWIFFSSNNKLKSQDYTKYPKNHPLQWPPQVY